MTSDLDLNDLKAKAEAAPLRCEVTGNPCGTDTWGEGYTCPCPACQSYLRTVALISALEAEREKNKRMVEGARTVC